MLDCIYFSVHQIINLIYGSRLFFPTYSKSTQCSAPAASVHITSVFLCTSPPDIFCCGLLSTRKSDCTGLPQSMLVCGSTPAQRGQSRVMMKGSLSLISWYNKGHFRFLTNAYSPTKQGKPDASLTSLPSIIS